ncbi:hypothetical protein N658DRAFT_480520 [Parathielavia hyrcaniae]|uniref:Uncharacterized protein n=1 Tax=Parathielavia hyrcaniae TaxID=113614 RepID=A0AAN6PRE8_9PEZI|nr:hypothetical protein N658DRAFT_480520 [Parathielavia hyrcaniae]
MDDDDIYQYYQAIYDSRYVTYDTPNPDPIPENPYRHLSSPSYSPSSSSFTTSTTTSTTSTTSTTTTPTTIPISTLHNLSLLTALLLTLLAHRDLAARLLYWLLRALKTSNSSNNNFPPVPAALRAPPNGQSTPYGATLHALRYETARNVAAARLALGAYAGAFVLLGMVLPPLSLDGSSGTEIVIGRVVVPAGVAYLYLAAFCAAVRWWVWGGGVVVATGRFCWRTAVEVAGEVGGYWGGVFMRYWRVVFVGGVGWVCLSVAREVDWDEIFSETAGAVLLLCAEVVYLSGDVVSDMARGRWAA